MKAVVMAGGEGSRLRPITANRPKPLVPVGNRPIMEHILELLKRHGITEVVSTLHYLADEISSYFDDGRDFGVTMHYSIEDTPLGTAGSVKKAEHLLRDERFLIVSGDALTDCDLTKALEFHKAKGSLATLVLYRVESPLEFGVVITDPDGKVIRFLEKPSWSEVFSDTVNTGMYILEPEIFDLMEPGKQYDWSQDIFPQLLREGKPMYGYIMEDYWCDVGTLTQYREAQEHLLSGRTTLQVPGIERDSGVWVDEFSVIDDGALLIPPVCVGRNCKIKSGSTVGPYSVIGDNALIEEGATVERSVIWDGAYIGPNVGIHSSILGSRVTIKRDSEVREDAIVGDRCLIDVGCTIRPRIKLWPDKIIERGTTVTMSLVWGNKWRGTLFRDLGVAGLSNIEITPDFATRLGSAFGSTLRNGATVVTARDSSRSSRMIKRAMMASLLSVGCEVVDLRSASAPVVRHYVRSSGATAAIYVRKMPGNQRVTSIEFFDASGAYLTKAQERKVESAFFREDFYRIDPDDLGQIELAVQAMEDYRAHFYRLLAPLEVTRRMRVVCDFGYSAIAGVFPEMMGRYGLEAIYLNSFNDARKAPRGKDMVRAHLDSLKHVVGTLGYDLGVLFLDEGERLAVVDDQGRILEGSQLFAAMATLVARTGKSPKVGMAATASLKVENYLIEQGVEVLRTKSDTRSLMQASAQHNVDFAGDLDGGFIFPEFHPGFDGMYGFVSLVSLLRETQAPLSELVEQLPVSHLAYEQVRCPWEIKGSVMRILAEEVRGEGEVDLLDGIKIVENGRWVLVIPDSVEPVFHVHSEGNSEEDSRALAEKYAGRLVELQSRIG